MTNQKNNNLQTTTDKPLSVHIFLNNLLEVKSQVGYRANTYCWPCPSCYQQFHYPREMWWDDQSNQLICTGTCSYKNLIEFLTSYWQISVTEVWAILAEQNLLIKQIIISNNKF